MLSRIFQNFAILMGSAFIIFMSFTVATDDAFPLLLDTMAFNHEVRRNPKFIIPSLLAHMYQKSDGESVMNTFLSRPSAKKVSKEADPNKKENIGNGLEHRPIIGNHKKDHLTQQKTKSPYIKLRESLANQGEETEPGKDFVSRLNDINGGLIEIKKGFSGVNRNWYGQSPMMWAPPVSYPNSYVLPYHQIVNSPRFSSYHESRPPDPMENLCLQGGVVHKPQSAHSVLSDKLKLRDTNRDGVFPDGEPKLANPQCNTQEQCETDRSNQLQTDLANKNIVTQERKFVITNVTKYVLDFYCPHCGGEISVSRAKSKGILNRGNDVTVKKGISNTFNKLEDTKNRIFYPGRTKTQE